MTQVVVTAFHGIDKWNVKYLIEMEEYVTRKGNYICNFLELLFVKMADAILHVSQNPQMFQSGALFPCVQIEGCLQIQKRMSNVLCEACLFAQV